ncbi:MAG: hypothetical protein IKU37_03100 [Candidatus Gastranaerophilales bacterium]|nr:hypothetical protein [Candidatus Gastranaerophilales bacterium]
MQAISLENYNTYSSPTSKYSLDKNLEEEIFVTFNSSNNEVQEYEADYSNLDVIDHRKEDGFFDKVCNFFKKIFHLPEYEIKQDGNKVSLIKNIDRYTSRISSYTFYDVNGELDEEIHQGNMEDCGLIAVCTSLASSEEGRKIIKDSISINYNENNEIESYSITFQGIDETYIITKEEFEKERESNIKEDMGIEKFSYSWGDNDMLLFELAWSKCYSESQKLAEYETNTFYFVTNTEMPKGLSGTNQDKLYYALTGGSLNDAHMYFTEQQEKNTIQQKRSNIVDFFANFENKYFTLSDILGSKVSRGGYGYGYNADERRIEIINHNDEYEILINPNEMKVGTITYKNKNTNDIYTVKYYDFLRICSEILTDENRAEIAENEYYAAMNSDTAVLGTNTVIDCLDINGSLAQLAPNHAYAVKTINENEIILLNPWNTSKEIVISKDELLKHKEICNYAFRIGGMDKD